MRVGRAGGIAGLLLSMVLVVAGCASSPEEEAPALEKDGLPDLTRWDPGAGATRQLVVISVSGLSPDRYLDAEGGMPVLRKLAGNGAAARRVTSVVPAAAYPVHVTLDSGATPRSHGVTGDRRLGSRGVTRAYLTRASEVESTRVWQPVLAAGEGVAAFDWPATQGSKIPLLIPDLVPGLADDPAALLQAGGSASLLEPAARTGVDLTRPSARRDAFLAASACRVLSARRAPRLVLLRLTQTLPALRAQGPHSPAARTAFANVDGEIEGVLRCLAEVERLAGTTLIVLGDVAWDGIHSLVRPNKLLADAALIDVEQGSWRAILRANGGSAFLYANDTDAALEARRLLQSAAERTGAFRVVGAEEMMGLQTDPEAWFGVEAEQGFTLVDSARGAFLQPAPWLGAPGSGASEATPGFVAFGRGVRRGLEVAQMRQLDVGPTLARLLGVELPTARGTAFVGLLRIESRVSTPPRIIPIEPGETR